MVPYRLKVMHVEYYIINSSPIIHKWSSYSREDNNFGEDSIMVLLYDEHSCDTIISDNTDIIINNVPEIRDSVLSYLHIGGVKYSIYSSKTETATNITIHKMN